MADKADVMAMDEVYNAAREHSDSEMAKLREEIEGREAEHFLLGTLAKIDYDNTHDRLLKYALLYQYKQKKEYLKGGKSWEEFLQSIGEDRRNVDRIFNDLRPIYDEFQYKLSGLAGITFNKIRYLGKSITGQMSGIEEGVLVFDGERIPVTQEHTEEIEAAIDAMKDAHRKDLREKDTTIKAKERILEEKERVITNLEHDATKLKDDIKELKWAEGEKDFLSQLGRLQTVIGTSLFRLDPETVFSESMNPTPRMRAAYVETVAFLRRWATAYDDTAKDLYGHPDVDGAWSTGMKDMQGAEEQDWDTLGVCERCKAAHPDCDKCCATCLNPCNLQQQCSIPGSES